MQTRDGPGLRTTVFFKGCPLRCAWCHNPESISPAPEIWWLAHACIACRTCIEVCPQDALELAPEGMRIDRERCNGCFRCVEACPAQAMEALRRDWTMPELLDEVLRDEAFFAEGGGVTASGGEPLAQWPAVRELLAACEARGIHTALDTCGQAPPEALEAVLPHTRLVLYDLKIADPAAHARWTGHDNRRILENLRSVADETRRRDDLALWIRTPLIPEATATRENLAALARFVVEEIGDAVERWELCAFNPLCADKYRKLGQAWRFEGDGMMPRSEAEALRQLVLAQCGLPEGQVLLTGRLANPPAKKPAR
jgi:pyruvate formate lyase activating enzyme